jgi:DNA-binding CsgD family transcriptional regulator
MTGNVEDVGLTHAQFSELVGAIYDCAVDSSRWQATLAALVTAFEAQNAVLSLSDIRYDRLLINRSVGIEPYWQRKQQEHLPEILGQLGQALASWPSPDDPFITSRHLTPEYVAQSPYFIEVLKPQKISDIMQYFLIGTPDRFAGFAVSKGEQNGLIGHRDIELGRLLLPHIRRSVVISDLLDARTIENERLGATLDAVAVGVVLVGAEGMILHVNNAARCMLDARSPIAAVGGRLAALQSDITNELQKAIHIARTDEAKIGVAGIGVPLIHQDMASATAHVLPLSRGNLRTRLAPQAVAAVFIVPAGMPIPADLSTVGRVFGLTPAETRMLAQFVAGASIAGAAAALGISQATAKTHQVHIFEKTGVARRSELLALIARLIPPIQQSR